MFDGVPDQFHQFIASRTSIPLPLSFPLHGSTQTTFPTFDPFPSHQTLQLQSHLLPQLHHHPPPPTTHKAEEKEQQNSFISTSLELERERSVSEAIDPWSNDEVLALLRIRSSMENWFPDFTWEHVSRKLSELGFKRSAEKCKDKFEEESRHFDNMSTYTKNYRFFSELEELCHGDNNQNPNKVLSERNQNVENLFPNKEDSRNETTNSSQENEKKPRDKKRKRHKRFQMLKGFCEEVVKKMMAQQEELHNKLIEDMVKKDEEKIAREEAWKRVEMERINKEIDIMAQEQAIASDRQSKLIEFLKKFTPNSSQNSFSFIHPQNPNPPSQPSSQQNPSSETLALPENPSSKLLNSFQTPRNTQKNPLSPTSSSTQKTPQNPNSAPNEKEDIGKRWPRDEVLALINLRCSLNSGGKGGGGGEDKEGTKGPLWERISQGMLELGYKRNAKRCKEKWENINKYFRKTKDVNKKRSLDSRTCPYFHQLSSLYSQGTLRLENRSSVPENHSDVPENRLDRSPPDGSSGGDANMHVDGEGEKNLIQVPAFEFEF
ncbi:hypothetical protein ACSBR2_005227 [Camellia fascicularis]